MWTYRWRFSHAGRAWQVVVNAGMALARYRVLEGDQERAALEVDYTEPDSMGVRTLHVETPEGLLEVKIGAVGWITYATQVFLNGALIYRSNKRDFHVPAALKKFTAGDPSRTPEERARLRAEAEARMPSVYVDLAMGVVFFFVAREFGLVNAAVTGAAVTLLLFIVQRFVKIDLLGGFAVFGVVMALISAGLAVAFQDELFVKLRGAVMGVIVASCFLTDAAFGGRYLGKRMASYLAQMMRIRPVPASLAMASAGLAVVSIDVAAAFTLKGDLWLFYNAFLDGLIAMPLVLGALWLAREKSAVKTP